MIHATLSISNAAINRPVEPTQTRMAKVVDLMIGLPARVLNPLQALGAFAARLYVSWQFLNSGYLKLTSWENTVFLFEYEYKVPLVSPMVAAITGTLGELLFPVLLLVGLLGRISAAGLFAVNLMAVIAYAHVLLGEGFEAALAQHVLWGFMLLALMLYGPGALSADRLLTRPRYSVGQV